MIAGQLQVSLADDFCDFVPAVILPLPDLDKGSLAAGGGAGDARGKEQVVDHPPTLRKQGPHGLRWTCRRERERDDDIFSRLYGGSMVALKISTSLVMVTSFVGCTSMDANCAMQVVLPTGSMVVLKISTTDLSPSPRP
jgi:hypothetical protein